MASVRRNLPLFSLEQQHRPLQAELGQAAARVLASNQFILSEEVAAFEREVAAALGVAHAVGVSSGSDALVCALQALGIGPEHEVVTTPFSFMATAEAVRRVGARLRFADIDAQHLMLSAETLRLALSERTRAVIVVHLYGAPAPLAELMAVCQNAPHPVSLIEDAAQAYGATCAGRQVGTLGALGAFSFFPTKPLGGFGDGGMVVTDSAEFFAQCQRIRVHGASRPQWFVQDGGNYRLDALQAALLRLKLPHVARWQDARRALVERYHQRLEVVPSVRLIQRAELRSSAHALFSVRVPAAQRDALAQALKADDIATAKYYATPLHLQPSLADLGLTLGALPNAEQAAREVLSLPLFVGMELDDVDRVCDAIVQYFEPVAEFVPSPPGVE